MREIRSDMRARFVEASERSMLDRIDAVAAARTLRLEPELDGISHELGVELAAVRYTAARA
jgi:hypothetical protein